MRSGGSIELKKNLSIFQNKGDGDCHSVGNLQNPSFVYYNHDGMPSSIAIGRSRVTVDCSGLDALVGSESP